MIYLIFAILFLTIAHYFKVNRLKQFIEIYESPCEKNLLDSLSIGYIANFIVPFRLGDLFRILLMGRKMKNGYSFSLAIVLLDRILDVIVVGIFFLIFYILGYRNIDIINSIYFYIFLFIIIFIFLFIGFVFNKYLKKVIRKIAKIFNHHIEFSILKFFWCFITEIKDLISNINKKQLFFNSAIMWLFYFISYCLFAIFIKKTYQESSLINIFVILFSKNSFDFTFNILKNENYYLFIYLFSALIFLLLLSNYFIKNNKNSNNHKYLELLPHMNEVDRLTFLEGYFSGNSREYFNNYIKLNRDISIIADYSAGSNATTMLCSKDGEIFYRKYTISKDCNKLHDQILWLEKNKNIVPVTKVYNVRYGTNYCSYDMPYSKDAISCFNYVHFMPVNQGFLIIKKVLNKMEDNLYIKTKNINLNNVEKYINDKVINNLLKIQNGNFIKPLLKYDYLYINGKKYKNLKYFYKYLSKDYLFNLFKNDKIAEIHGDFTIENIIVKNKSFYIIDPNTGNIHESPFLDYGKLLQSLHGGYEFLMNTKSIDINKNNINFMHTKSKIYDELYDLYLKYLYKKFSKEEVKSIFFHEIVHWIRLLPYKIEKNGQRSVIFYAELIIILNDVIEMFGDNDEKCSFI